MSILQITVYQSGEVYPRKKPLIQHALPIEGSVNEFVFNRDGLSRVNLRAGDDCWVTWWGDDPQRDGSNGVMLFAGDEQSVEAENSMTIKVAQRNER